jgi:hypothetical protein
VCVEEGGVMSESVIQRQRAAVPSSASTSATEDVIVSLA